MNLIKKINNPFRSIFNNYLLLTFLLGVTSLSGQQKFTIESAIQFSISNSPILKTKHLDLEEAIQTIIETRAIGIPKLSAKVDYQYYIQTPKTPFSFGPKQGSTMISDLGGRNRLISYIETDPNGVPLNADPQLISFVKNNGLSGNITLSSLIFDASYLYALRAAKTYTKLVKSNIKVTEQDVIKDIQKSFLDILFIEKNKETVGKNLENIRSSLKETQQIYKNGFAEKLDVDRLSLSIKNLEVELLNLNQAKIQVKTLLKYQMGYSSTKKIEIIGDFSILAEKILNESLPQNLDYSNRAELVSFNLSDSLNALNIDLLKAKYYPNLTGFIQHSQTIQRDNLFNSKESGFVPSTIVGLTINATIFDGWSRSAKIEKAKISRLKNLANLSEFERGITLQANSIKINLENAKRTAIFRQESLTLAQNIYNTSKIKYVEGIGSSVELRQAERDLYMAQSNYNTALYKVLNYKFELNKTLGTILSR